MIKKHSLIVLILTLSSLVTINPSLNMAQPSTVATVYIGPPEVTNLTIGDTFAINIAIANVSNLGGWQIALYYNSKVLNGTGKPEEGPFLKDVGPTFFSIDDWNDDYNETHGHAKLACAILTGATADGDGTLAILTFKVKGADQSTSVCPRIKQNSTNQATHLHKSHIRPETAMLIQESTT